MSRSGATLLGLALAVSGPVGCAATAASFEPTSPVVPFRRDGEGRVVLNGAVDGRPASTLLDSGSVGAIVSDALIDPATARPVDTAILNGQARVERWAGVRIDIGPLSITPKLVSAADRTGRPDVVIGNAVFEQAVVEIDFEGGTVTFHQPAEFTAPAGAVAWPLGRDGERMTAELSLNGGPPVCAAVDLGFNEALSLAPPVVESQGLPANPALTITQQTVGRDPIVVPGLARIERVTIAGFDLANVSASPGGFNAGPCGSLIGTELLSGFRLYFDLPHDTLWLTPRADLEPRFEKELGVTYRNTPTGKLVTAIAKSSPAFGVLAIGERVTRIEGEPPVFVMATGEVRTTAPGQVRAE